MSSNLYFQENSSSIQTRRSPARSGDNENNSQRQKNARSLSGKFRNLFRKDSASPNRNSTNERVPSPQPTTRQQSQSSEPLRTSTETPILRAPLVDWSFGKKKNPSSSKSEKKPKKSRKSKKNSLPTIETNVLTYTYGPDIPTHSQTYVSRTPENTYGSTTPTRGFRDYTIIDNSKSTQQVITSNIDYTTPPSYSSDLRRSPLLDRQNIHYANLDYTRRFDTSVSSSGNRTISNLEIIPGPTPQRQVNNTIQSLVENTPLVTQTSTYPSSSLGTFTNSSNQWKVSSNSSLNNIDRYTARPVAVDVDAPKLHAPTISFGHHTTNREYQTTDLQFNSNQTYHPSSTLNKYDRPYYSTYSSLQDKETVYPDSSYSTDKTYPWLSAIVQHHMRPSSTIYNNHPWILPDTSYQTHRFNASTTTFRDSDSRETSSPLDGYIRPLTPSKSPIQPDVTIIHIDPHHDYRPGSQTSYTTTSDVPISYRSSATIYTRDKQNFSNGGEIRTWSVRDNDDIDTNKKSSTSIFIGRSPDDHQVIPLKAPVDSTYKSKFYGQELNDYPGQKEGTLSTGYADERRQHQQYFYDARYYSSSHYSDSTIDNRNYIRSPIGNERDNYYDRSAHIHRDTDQTQDHRLFY